MLHDFKLISNTRLLSVLRVALAAVSDQPVVEEASKNLWEADWDDEETTEDFQQKLRQELGRHMQD